MRHLTDQQFRGALTAALAVPRFVDEVADGGPYDTVDDVLAAATRAATPLSADEIEQALAHHPRIGETPTGDSVSERMSRAEQSTSDDDDEALAAALADGNRAYEERFDRVFLIRAAGRSRAEILAELRRRLDLDVETERRIVGEQLREIAILRLDALLA